MTGQLDRHYAGVERIFTKENMTYVILKNYSDHFKSVKALKKDQDIKLMKVQKKTFLLWWFETANTFWNAYIGTRNGPLAYVVQKEVLPSATRLLLLIH